MLLASVRSWKCPRIRGDGTFREIATRSSVLALDLSHEDSRHAELILHAYDGSRTTPGSTTAAAA